jgi:glycyl-tRNA synthetase beta chain
MSPRGKSWDILSCRTRDDRMGELLLEIGTEEIPSNYLGDGLRDLRRLAESYLRENRIGFADGLVTCGTPRRLILVGEAVADKQEDIAEEVTGPPTRAAFDGEGNPTKAALGFAEKQGVSVGDLQVMDTPRGKYVYVKRQISGRTTRDVLAKVLPKLIAEIPWPKSMRWGDVTFSFVRPIHWILALFDREVIPFEVAGVRSENKTRGHRFMAPQVKEVSDYKDFLQKMEEGYVIIDEKEREGLVERIVQGAARTLSGEAMLDPELLTTVTSMVEFPSALCGSFDETFLDLPEEVLITVMKAHQRYFAVRDKEGRLMSNFVAVNNTLVRNEAIVRKGHERVLRARLKDADYFFKEDRKRAFEDKLDDLKDVIYQAELGTSFAKVQRFARLSEYLASEIAPEKIDLVMLAARLCKCDLVTEMVMEFPTLQGIMGREYARFDGHPEEVCLAIYEHYLPERAGDELPSSPVGAIVGVSDRMDTITGCFAIQLEPTGATDPFALRRHALAILRILEGMEWDLSLKDLIATSLSILGEEIDFHRDLVFQKVLNFFRERYKNMMLRSGYESDLIDAILSVEFDRIYQVHARIVHLKKFKAESKEFQSLALTFKRVSNILKNQKQALAVNPDLFQEPCESVLWAAYQDVKDDVYRLVEEKNYFDALNLMVAKLRRPVDDLFEGVEILTKDDPELRKNRVALLQGLARLFLRLADFSKFSI